MINLNPGILFNGIGPLAGIGLLAASFADSFITISMGIGGAMLLAVMASLMPPDVLIPVHRVIQLGSRQSSRTSSSR